MTIAYRTQWDTGAGDVEASAVVDPDDGTITITAPGAEPIVVDVVGARALRLLVDEALLGALQPTPYLIVESRRDDGRWVGAGEAP